MALVDLTQFTEVDTGGNLTVDETSVVFSALDTGDVAYTYYDFGAGHITGEWTILWDFEVNNLTNSGDLVVSLTVGDGSPVVTQGFVCYVTKFFNDFRIITSKLGTFPTTNVFSIGSTQDSGHLWATLTHEADDTFTVTYHSDADRTVQVHTGIFEEDSQSYSHMEVVRSPSTGSDTDVEGYVQNVDVTGFDIPMGTADYTTDISWDILNDSTNDFSWDIVADLVASTSWNIFPAIVEFIQNAKSRSIRTNFKVIKILSNFLVLPIDTNFNADAVIDTSYSIEPVILGTFNVKKIQTSYTLKYEVQTNFLPTVVNNNERIIYP